MKELQPLHYYITFTCIRVKKYYNYYITFTGIIVKERQPLHYYITFTGIRFTYITLHNKTPLHDKNYPTPCLK